VHWETVGSPDVAVWPIHACASLFDAGGAREVGKDPSSPPCASWWRVLSWLVNHRRNPEEEARPCVAVRAYPMRKARRADQRDPAWVGAALSLEEVYRKMDRRRPMRTLTLAGIVTLLWERVRPTIIRAQLQSDQQSAC